MKRSVLLLSFALLFTLLSGCGGEPSPAPGEPYGLADPAAPGQEAVISPEPEGPEAGTERVRPVPASYEDVLDLYYAALSERWETSAVTARGLSSLCTYYYEGEPLENVGYLLQDLDGDGTEELLIGAIVEEGRYADSFYQPSSIFDIYTLSEGQPVNVAQSFERSRRYLLPEGRIYGEGSGGYANSTHALYQMRGTELVMTEAVISDGAAFPDVAGSTELNWYQLRDGNWDTAAAERLTREQAEEQSAAYRAQVIRPNYTPLSQYTPRTAPTPPEWTRIPGFYRYILDSYYLAATDEWDSGQLMINELNTLCINCYEGEAAENIGWLLRDLDGDGTEELLIGVVGGENFTDRLLLDLYTLTDGPYPDKQVLFQSWERDRYFQLADGRFYRVSSPEAGCSMGTVYTYDGGALVFSEGVMLLTAEDGPGEYYSLDADGRRGAPLPEDEGEALLAAWRDSRVEPDFKPLSEYWRMSNED